MAIKKEKNDTITLKEAIALYAEKDEFIFVHRHNIDGYYKYKVSEISDRLMDSEIVRVRKGFGGIKHNYSSTLFIIK